MSAWPSEHIAIELCLNGPMVPAKVDERVRRSLAWLVASRD
jgi:hypothetical protein